METIEYRTIDKSSWSRGPWDDEPDKKQWRDPATGLACLIVRNHFGNWCGYVGVPPAHPWHGLGYSDTIPGRVKKEDWDYENSIGGAIEVHGGLTFASECRELSREAYEKWLAMIEKSRSEARQYPRGDAAQRVKTAAAIHSFEEWVEHFTQRSICHISAPGEPEVWWFGFDCGHAGDWSPGMEQYRAVSDDEYRDQAYIEAEVTKLARQLADVRAAD